MAKPSYGVRIRARIAELKARILEAETELKELQIAEKVIERLSLTDDEDAEVLPRSTKNRTVSDVILDVLTTNGQLESRDVFERAKEIQETTFNTVSTTLSRMKEQGLVSLDGRMWSLALQKEEAPSAQAEGASKPEDSETDPLGIFS